MIELYKVYRCNSSLWKDIRTCGFYIPKNRVGPNRFEILEFSAIASPPINIPIKKVPLTMVDRDYTEVDFPTASAEILRRLSLLGSGVAETMEQVRLLHEENQPFEQVEPAEPNQRIINIDIANIGVYGLTADDFNLTAFKGYYNIDESEPVPIKARKRISNNLADRIRKLADKNEENAKELKQRLRALKQINEELEVEEVKWQKK